MTQQHITDGLRRGASPTFQPASGLERRKPRGYVQLGIDRSMLFLPAIKKNRSEAWKYFYTTANVNDTYSHAPLPLPSLKITARPPSNH